MYPSISSGYSWLRSAATLLSCWWSCCLFRCWLGGLFSHSSFYIWIWCILGRQSDFLVLQAVAHDVLLQCRGRVSCCCECYCWDDSFLRNSILYYGGLHLCTVTMWVLAISRPIRCNINTDRPALCPWQGCCWSCPHSSCSYYFTVRWHLHQGPPIYGLQRVSYQPGHLSWTSLSVANWRRSDCRGVLDL
jgi:hypothetical protein